VTYVALYREWRPQNFSEVVGQKHVTRTLVNALKQSRISHAYLFCGPRGTGKTSIAKILAKAVNCLEPYEGEPCNQCSNCKAIKNGSSLDVLEIDAASNRGIDEIRDLRERVQFVPSGGRFRVYIIDEVHMLTTEAFNALLKTLEEPPGHVIFVLATTEAHKLPATILSRCQRFDFHRISRPDLLERLNRVAVSQNITVTEDALKVMVQAAEGGLRDALSLLDQCIGFADSVIRIEDVNQVLGTVSEELLAQVVDALKKNEPGALIRLVGVIIDQGKDVRKFVRDLIGYFRDLLLIKLGEQTDQLVVALDSERLMNQANQWHAEQIIRLIHFFTRLETDMKWAIQPRWMLEAALVDAGENQGLDKIEEIRLRVESLEQSLQSRIGFVRPGSETIAAKKSSHLKSDPSVLTEIDEGLPENRAFRTQSDSNSTSSNLEAVVKLAGELDISGIQKQWKQFMDVLRKRNVALQALLLEAEPMEMREGILELVFRKGRNFHRQKVEEAGNKNMVEEVLMQIFHQPLRIHCKMQEALDEQRDELRTVGELTDPWQEPLVQAAVEIFGAERIKITDG